MGSIAPIAGLIAALAALHGPASAAPPPPRVEIIAFSSDRHGEGLAEAYLMLVARSGAFDRAPASFNAAQLHGCATEEKESCIRRILQHAKAPRALVVVVAEDAGNAAQRWRCIGVGKVPFAAEKQTATLDLSSAFFGQADARFQESLRATACIMSAAAESGW